MSPSTTTSNIATSRYANVFLLALIAAGVAGNYLKFQLFLNVDFLFGSIFALLALQFFGPARGILAAALIASVTYFILGHPYAILFFTTEVAAVAWLISRYKVGLVLADALYWLFIGMPMVYLFHHGVMGVELGNVTILMIKAAENGIVNALLARLIFTAFALRTRSSQIAYRDLIYNLLAFFALCPALILLVVGSRSDFAEADHNIRVKLHQNSLSVTNRLDVWLQNRSTAVVKLAERATTHTPRQMQDFLEMATRSDLNYLRIGLADEHATAVAFFPLVDELGKSTIGLNFAERPYVPVLKRTLKPMFSEVIMGKVGIAKPQVVMLAPVVKAAEYSGYVFGVIDLDQIRNYLEKTAETDTLLYTLVDKNNNVIVSNRKEQRMMTPFVRDTGSLENLDHGVSQWIPSAVLNAPRSERWRNAFYVAESKIGSLAEWRLILEQPVAPFQKAFSERYAGGMALLLLMLLAALVLAELLARRVVDTTERLSEMTACLPALLATGDQPAWPESAVRESRRLIDHFKEMAATLAAQFIANRELNATLEKRVEERTRALEASMEELKRSNADLEQFAYAASHDMRQPLRMISSYLQLLAAELDQFLNDETRTNFHFAIDGAQRMDHMLAALLDYSRVGRNSDDMAAIDSRAVLDAVLQILQPAIAEAQADVRIEGEWGSAPQLVANRDEILRLFQNLIENALKFRVEGRTPEVVVSASLLPSVLTSTGGGEWCFAVKDNGVGLLPGQEKRIFKVFERFQPRAKYPGTGIGLALCRRIVEHHDGRIWVESAGENQGCSFIFVLPAAAGASVLPEPPPHE